MRRGLRFQLRPLRPIDGLRRSYHISRSSIPLVVGSRPRRWPAAAEKPDPALTPAGT